MAKKVGFPQMHSSSSLPDPPNYGYVHILNVTYGNSVNLGRLLHPIMMVQLFVDAVIQVSSYTFYEIDLCVIFLNDLDLGFEW